MGFFNFTKPKPDEISVPMSVLEIESKLSNIHSNQYPRHSKDIAHATVEGSSSGLDSHTSPFGIDREKKGEDYVSDFDVDEVVTHTEVVRGLSPRQLSMIAIGGTIGTGLFISTGSTLSLAGPASSLIAFGVMTSLVYAVTQGLGEMATAIPIAGSFTQYMARWGSPALGAANAYNYFFSWAITFALELSIVGQLIEYWTDAVPLAAWISIFFVLIPLFNMFPVRYYGEFEFWLALVKVIAVAGWLIYALCMMCGAGKTGPIGFRYYHHPGAWGPGYLVPQRKGLGRFLGFWKSLVSAAFTFQGCETIGVAASEAKNPRKTIPSAIRKVLFRILVFYVLCMFFLGVLVPFDDDRLTGSNTKSSPFIIAMQISGTKVLPHIFNAVLVVTVISAGNSNVYLGSRILYAIGEAKVGPRFLMRTNKWGVPWISVSITSAFGSLGYLAVSDSGTEAFDWLLNISASAGLIAWGGIAFSHLRFMAILRKRGISRDTLPYKAPFMPYGSYYACGFVFLIVITQGFDAFWDSGTAFAQSFFVAYISPILFVVCWIFFHILFNILDARKGEAHWFRLLVPIDECDIDTGAVVDEYEEEEPKKGIVKKIFSALA